MSANSKSLNYKVIININKIIIQRIGKIMKKILISVLLLLGTFSLASAEIGVNIGASGSIGLYDTKGSETEIGPNATDTVESKKQEMLGGMASVFIEKELSFLPGPLKRISIGYDHVIHEIKTGTSSQTVSDLRDMPVNTGAAQIKSLKNAASATVDNINTLYATVRITDWLYAKYGSMEADVISTEDLETGSTYGNASVDGTVMAIGLNFETEGGVFTRFEYEDIELDGFKLQSETNTDNSVKINDINGESFKVSIGKAF